MTHTGHRDPGQSPRARNRRQAGFSFIEILIVMGIIGVLVGGVIAAIGIWGRKGPEFTTKSRVRSAATLAHSWKQRFDFFPPGDVKNLGKTMGIALPVKGGTNSTNRGIEAYMQALKAPGFRAGSNWEANEVGNSDGDKLDTPIATDGDPELIELNDAWGNPLIYFNNDEYDKFGEQGRMVMLGDEATAGEPGDEISAYPWRDANGRYINAETFQVFSMGPDGEPNTDDDIGNWNAD